MDLELPSKKLVLGDHWKTMKNLHLDYINKKATHCSLDPSVELPHDPWKTSEYRAGLPDLHGLPLTEESCPCMLAMFPWYPPKKLKKSTSTKKEKMDANELYQGRVALVEPKLTKTGQQYTKMKVRVNTGFSFKYITFNNFEFDHPVAMESKVLVEVKRNGSYLNLVALELTEFLDCPNCEAPILNEECQGCRNEVKEKFLGRVVVIASGEQQYQFGPGRNFELKTKGGEIMKATLFQSDPHYTFGGSINAGSRIIVEGWTKKHCVDQDYEYAAGAYC